MFPTLGSRHQDQVEDQGTLKLDEDGPQVDIVLRTIASSPDVVQAPEVLCPVGHLTSVGRVLFWHGLRPRSGKVSITLVVEIPVLFVEAEVDIVSSGKHDDHGRKVESEPSSKERA